MTVRHIPGKTNVLADASSRLYSMDWRQRDANQIAVLNALGHIYVEQACTEYAQLYDINQRDVMDPETAVLHTTANTVAVAAPRLPVDLNIDEAPEEEPQLELETVWREAHCRGKGHRGARKTYNELARRLPDVAIAFDWVQAQVDDCALCQKFKADIGIALKTARHVLIADNHRSQISIDVVGMELDDFGKTVCFVITNHNTKLAYLYAADGKEEKDTINAVLSYIGLYARY
jgi:hypothetical protein